MILEDAGPRHYRMDSLPEQHIDSLPDHAREHALWQVGVACFLRGKGRPEEEVAEGAEFGSVEDMYFRLRRWGLPGLVPLEEEPKEAPKTARERKGRLSGPVKDLPPAGLAAPLFREKLDLLGRANEDLKYRKEKRQAGRFILSRVDTSPQPIRREDYPEELWEGIANTHNLDASADTLYIENGRTFSIGDATHVPQSPLPALIAVYVLMGGEIEPLFELLAGGTPTKEVREQIRRVIEGTRGSGGREDGLKVLVGRLATLMRGGDVSGRNRKPVSALEFQLICRIREGREAGIPDEKIYEGLRHFRLSEDSKELTWDEFRELARSESRWPWG